MAVKLGEMEGTRFNKPAHPSYRWRVVVTTAITPAQPRTDTTMGVNIGDLVSPRATKLEALTGKIVAIDAYNTLYQFLSIIRQPDGTPLQDTQGRVTSHLSGLIYRTSRLLEQHMKPIFVFDGQPSELKTAVIKARSERRREARQKWEVAKVVAPEEALKYAKASTRLSDEIIEDTHILLGYLGVPCVQAPTEGEAQAAYMVHKGDAELVSSQDFDCLLFGAPMMIRNLTAPRRDAKLELISLHEVEAEHGITRENLVDIAILIGTDFNPGVKGIGAKRALKLIRDHHRIEEILEAGAIAETEGLEGYERVREIFLQPAVNTSYELTWDAVNEAKVLEFLCESHDFSEERVRKALEKLAVLTDANKAKKTQRSIEQWL